MQSEAFDVGALLDRARRVLFVHAHPDDETLATGALIVELVRRGVDVHVLTATRGERGELMPGVAEVEPGSEDFVALREEELRRALQALGVAHHCYLGHSPARDSSATEQRTYRDSGMRWIRDGLAVPADDSGPDAFTAAPTEESTRDLAAYVHSTSPDLLISYDAGGGYGHPDHVLAHEITRQVAREVGIPMLEVIPQEVEVDGDPSAVLWLDLNHHLPTVQKALRAHATQVRVEGTDVVHVGGQRQPIATRMGLRLTGRTDRP